VALAADSMAFTNASQNATSYAWDFGDGTTDFTESPAHAYASAGAYTVTLTAGRCDQQDTATQTILLEPDKVPSAQDAPFWEPISPNPATRSLHVRLTTVGMCTYEIQYTTGAVLQAGTVSLAQPIAIDQLADGLYYLRLFEQGKCIGQQAFVKQFPE